jgi:SAM-dependent methyltransferase
MATGARAERQQDAGAEAAWWDRYAPLVDRIWHYDDYLHQAVRSEYLDEMYGFLFKPGGRLLDYGCGTGWFSLPFAQRGMWVDGIDASSAQVHRARQAARSLGLTNVRFWRATSLGKEQDDTYDAVLLHALVHHVPVEQRQVLLGDVGNALLDGGKLYIYEPLAAPDNPPWQATVATWAVGALLRILHEAARMGRLYAAEIAAAMRDGWTLGSPQEQPARLDQLLRLLPPQLSVLTVHPWHCWSISYANYCMSLHPAWRKRLERAAPFFCRLDRQALATAWYPYLRPWPLVSILAQKRVDG